MAKKIWMLKIYKAFGGRTADRLWSNTYDIATEEDITSPAWLPLINVIATREVLVHSTNCHMMRAVLSTLDEENPQQPKALRVVELQGVGQRGIPADQIQLPLDMALKVKKAVAYGRSGTLFYRGVLHSGDVTVGAGGIATLKAPMDGNLQNNITGFMTQIEPQLTALAANIVMRPVITGQVATVIDDSRIVLELAPSGVSLNKRNHRYFDKAASDDGVGVGT
jgi:hypothetical protein